MKKLLIAAGVAVAALGFTACNGGSTSGNGSADDSLAILLGRVQGTSYIAYWNQAPDSIKAKLNKNDFIDGLRSVLTRDSKKDQAYLMGVSTGMQFMQNIEAIKDNTDNFDVNLFINNFAEAFKKDSVDEAALMKAQQTLQIMLAKVEQKMREKHEAQRKQQEAAAAEAAAGNIKAGKEYVEAQKKADPAIKTLPSGVSYKVIKEGTGEKPGKTANVKVKYTGKHINGEVFDTSKDEARQFNVSGVVPGFGEILQMMAPGAKYVAYIPSDQGYGNSQAGSIEPGETLVFEIELVEVEAQPVKK